MENIFSIIQGISFTINDIDEIDEDDDLAFSILLEDLTEIAEGSGYDICFTEDRVAVIGKYICQINTMSPNQIKLIPLERKDREEFFNWVQDIVIFSRMVSQNPPDRNYSLDIFCVKGH